MTISLIAAVANNNVIGYKGKMPWGSIPKDLKRFKDITIGKPCIMGRKTYKSIGGYLPRRANIIMSHESYDMDKAVEAALLACCRLHTDEIMIIGGAEIFKQFLPIADAIYLTRIYMDVEGDTYFPSINEDEWHCPQQTDIINSNDINIRYRNYFRVKDMINYEELAAQYISLETEQEKEYFVTKEFGDTVPQEFTALVKGK